MLSCPKLGLMNNPKRDLILEIENITKAGFEFIDLVLEPPNSTKYKLNPIKTRNKIKKAGLSVLIHSWYEMKYAFPNKKIRNYFINELKKRYTFR